MPWIKIHAVIEDDSRHPENEAKARLHMVVAERVEFNVQGITIGYVDDDSKDFEFINSFGEEILKEIFVSMPDHLEKVEITTLTQEVATLITSTLNEPIPDYMKTMNHFEDGMNPLNLERFSSYDDLIELILSVRYIITIKDIWVRLNHLINSPIVSVALEARNLYKTVAETYDPQIMREKNADRSFYQSEKSWNLNQQELLEKGFVLLGVDEFKKSIRSLETELNEEEDELETNTFDMFVDYYFWRALIPFAYDWVIQDIDEAQSPIPIIVAKNARKYMKYLIDTIVPGIETLERLETVALNPRNITGVTTPNRQDTDVEGIIRKYI